MRRLSPSCYHLCSSKPRDPDHSDITITPGWFDNPLNQVISICHPLHYWIPRIGVAKTPKIPNDMNITSGGKEFCVTTLCRSTPERSPGRLVIARFNQF